MKIKPLKRNVALTKIEVKEEIQGGIIIPQSSDPKQQPHEYMVTEIGPEVTRVKVGDLVLVSRFGGTEYKKLKIYSELDIIAILKRGK